jgi:hypothetical protein
MASGDHVPRNVLTRINAEYRDVQWVAASAQPLVRMIPDEKGVFVALFRDA